MALHGIVASAIAHAGPTRIPGAESGKLYDIRHIDFEKRRAELLRISALSVMGSTRSISPFSTT